MNSLHFAALLIGIAAAYGWFATWLDVRRRASRHWVDDGVTIAATLTAVSLILALLGLVLS